MALTAWTTDAAAQEIHGCIKSNGVLKVVAAPDNCGNNETPISWNQQGPPGPKGDPGEPGMDGEPGAQGPAGPSLRILDGDGNVLGLVGHDGLRPFNEDLGLSIPLGTLRGRSESNVFFDEAGCGANGGQAYVFGHQSDKFIGDSNTLFGPYPSPNPRFFAARAEFVASVGALSELTGDGCTDYGSEQIRTNLLVADEFTGQLPFQIPVPEPIHIDLPAE